MSPAERVAALYDADSPRTFREDVEAHMLTGYVFATPEAFLMGRAIDSGATPEAIADPWHAFPRDAQDTWLIYAYADRFGNSPWGLVKKVLCWMPYPLKNVAWSRKRDGRLRFFDIQKLNERTHEILPPQSHRH